MIELFLQDPFPFSGYFLGAFSFVVAAFTSIFSVANPLAVMPAFLSLTEGDDDAHRRWLAKKASFYMFLVLVVFLFAGTYIMSFLVSACPGYALPAD